MMQRWANPKVALRAATVTQYVCVVGAALLVIWTIAAPERGHANAATVPTRPPPDMPAIDAEAPALESFAVLWTRDLQETLIEPKVEPKRPPPPPPPPPPVKLPSLVATFLDRGERWALLRTLDGDHELVRSGAPIDGFIVKEISEQRITLTRSEKDYRVLLITEQRR